MHDLRSAEDVVGSSTGARLLVGGATGVGLDFADVLSGKLPVFIAIVVVLAAVMLLVVFRSLVISLQAAVMNVLSIGAASGSLSPCSGTAGWAACSASVPARSNRGFR